jgi:tetratricopeptide (TPR) repeat protein
LALVAWAYLPVFRNGFINLDDGVYVYDNARVQNGLTWENIRWASTTLHFGLWHPLTWVSHMLDCQCFGLRPGWHHLTSVLLHGANTVLLFVVLRRMTGALWRPALVAALFALHPLHVESVAWVAERKDVLSTFFVMLTIWAYGCYAERSVIGSQGHASRVTRRGSPFYLLALFFFALGLMSKPMIVTLPLVLLLLDYWPLKRFELAAFVSRPSLPARLVLEKLPFVLAAVLTSLITLRAANRDGWLSSAAHCSLADRIANATLSYARYLLQVFWPGDLAVYYPLPATFSAWSVAGAALLLLGISVAAFCMARRWPYVVVGWLWYLVTLLPVIGLMIQLAAYSHADRYTYVPLIGLFVSLVWGAGEIVSHWRRPALACAAAAVAAAILLCLAQTRQQVGYWKESETLFRHALAVTKDNWMAHNNLGTALYREGRDREAIPHFQECIRLQPGYAFAHLNLGNALLRVGGIDDTIRAYQAGLKLKPDEAEAQFNLATLLLGKGRLEEAIRHFQQALTVQPDYAEAHNNLGTTLYNQGHAAEAIRQFQEALRLKPDYADARKNLDFVLATKADSPPQPGASTNP